MYSVRTESAKDGTSQASILGADQKASRLSAIRLNTAFHVCRSRRRSITKVAGMERSHIRRAAATAAAAILLCLVSDGSIVPSGSGSSFRII